MFFFSISLSLCRGQGGGLRVSTGTRGHFSVQWPLAPEGLRLAVFCFVCRESCVAICKCVHVCMTEEACLCVDAVASACSWRCGDGVQVLHQALKMSHLLGQLIGLVAAVYILQHLAGLWHIRGVGHSDYHWCSCPS